MLGNLHAASCIRRGTRFGLGVPHRCQWLLIDRGSPSIRAWTSPYFRFGCPRPLVVANPMARPVHRTPLLYALYLRALGARIARAHHPHSAHPGVYRPADTLARGASSPRTITSSATEHSACADRDCFITPRANAFVGEHSGMDINRGRRGPARSLVCPALRLIWSRGRDLARLPRPSGPHAARLPRSVPLRPLRRLRRTWVRVTRLCCYAAWPALW